LCTERTYVHEDIYDEFVEKLILETAKYTVGDPRDSNSRLGAMCGKTHYEKVKEYFEHGLKNGYNVAGYGKTVLNLPEHCKNGYFLPPTVMKRIQIIKF
jgi:aminomuconate-semialdehyde/2-hydroxymuconate-6-semialdehyde dehydrogenase